MRSYSVGIVIRYVLDADSAQGNVFEMPNGLLCLYCKPFNLNIVFSLQFGELLLFLSHLLLQMLILLEYLLIADSPMLLLLFGGVESHLVSLERLLVTYLLISEHLKLTIQSLHLALCSVAIGTLELHVVSKALGLLTRKQHLIMIVLILCRSSVQLSFELINQSILLIKFDLELIFHGLLICCMLRLQPVHFMDFLVYLKS